MRAHNAAFRQVVYGITMALVAFMIKHHYSIASTTDLQWMLAPLANLLSLLLPGDFIMQTNGEWIHHDWHIHLVKSCAGVNFFLMSLAGYAWIFGPLARNASGGILATCGSYTVLAILSAWLSSITVNVMRICLAIFVVRHESWFAFLALSAEDSHRLIGIAVYFPALVLQLQMACRNSLSANFKIATCLFILVLIIVPLINGNALQTGSVFLSHTLSITAYIAIAAMMVYLLGLAKKRLAS